ncbi:ECF RNA polymerase sigma factor SigE [Aquisphaera giovannonii]|uniref:ECF RNA polymerase sigma factor SigE n=1 Tax=Aquisphaera giovannonii TaxID=406548 RepID=A0A5B9VYM9_9BACT|nr:RNA polymerase sigma factor [Aquisphaera giovannonii]QEH33466.1 ECF RNA polymerase sigma factor SigE [Aquisphaera giovannonii]
MRDPTGNDADARLIQEAFVRETYEGLYRWLRRLSGSAELAADLTQEAFAAYWASRDRRPPGLPPRGWLYAIGRNLWRKAARDRRVPEPAELSLLAAADRPPDLAYDDREFDAAVQAALSRLPAELREVFVLRFWHEFEYAEIAAVQGASSALVRWRYFAARGRLHRELADWAPISREKEGHHAS